jgi:Family of unknown function (DUF5691)
VSTWQDLVTASLIGTERTEVPPAAVPGVLTSAPAAATQDPAAVLLDRAALLTAARRAGWRPVQADPLPAAEPDPRPAMSHAAGSRLARMLGGEYPELLAEWLTAAIARGLRPPPELLPALLDRTRRAGPADSGLSRLVAEAGGPRARWLAGLNPDWELVTAQHLPADDAWRLGRPTHLPIPPSLRRGYLASLRASDPGAARELIAGSWGAAGPDDRVMFVRVMADGPSLADEPLLEAALDDETAWVRRLAADVLAALPGSALARRMTERAVRCLRIEHGPRGTRLVVTPPAESDALTRRDGIAPGPAGGSTQPADQARLMLEVVARTPLRTWRDEFGLGAAQIVTLWSGDWAPVLFTAWSRAATAQRDQDWMSALLRRALTGWTGRPPRLAGEIEALRQLARRADPRLGGPAVLPDPGPDAPPVIREATRLLRFRYDMLKELDDHDSGD